MSFSTNTPVGVGTWGTGLPMLVALLLAIGTGCTGSEGAANAGSDAGSLEGSAMSEEQRAAATEVWEPVPAVVTPGRNGSPPSDAVVLFDGSDLSAWTGTKGRDAGWRVEDGAMTIASGSGNLITRQRFGDVQLHVEWRTPAEVSGEGQGRGNSGVYLMERYEVQILDSYANRTYSNGQAGAIYKQHIPMVNASRGPGEWQAYDIVFTAPRFKADGSLARAAFMTVFHNGVLIQNHVELRGPTRYIGNPTYQPHADRLPLMLQDHGNPVSFRNIWVREIAGGS